MQLAILDPGHFHAALVQKSMYPDVDATVHVYAPPGPELDDYLHRIEGYNTRAQAPTRWQIQMHSGPDYLERFARDKVADVAVIAGNNGRKAEYIERAVDAGYQTLADKPMAIDAGAFAVLERAFTRARETGVLLYDIMTERFEIATMLQKEFAHLGGVFGALEKGTPDTPAVVKESVHYWSKLVSGVPIKRPAWFFDTAQQGEGLVDITTHLVDLVQWACFPGVALDYRGDVEVIAARRWPTALTAAQFARVTQLPRFPEHLLKATQADGSLCVYANGEIRFALRGVHARVSVVWDYEAPAGAGDTHYSVLRGTKATLTIRQGAAEGHQPTLYIEAAPGMDTLALADALAHALPQVQAKYPGVDLARSGEAWQVVVAAAYHVGHEAHFGQVTEQFLSYVAKGELPAWEVPNMLAKYYTTTQALALATLNRQTPA